VMGRDGRLTRAGYWVLLVAMAVQGLTPDDGNLASSLLLRLVSAGPAGDMALHDDASSLPPPLHGGDENGVPGAFCRTVAVGGALRVRLDDGTRTRLPFLPAGLLDRPNRSAPRSILAPGPVPLAPGGLIPALGRFRC
jgi:hypothetical protein